MPISDDFSKPPKSPSKSKGRAKLDISGADLVSDDLPRLRNDLYVLQIHDNLEGRLKFSEQWEYVSEYIFGEELLSYDYHGTPDKIRRAWLENRAEENRLDFIELCNGLDEHKSSEYIKSVIARVGRDVASRLYAPEILDNFAPDSTLEAETEARDVSPEAMSLPMAPVARKTDKTTQATKPKDPINPFSAMSNLPKADEVEDIIITEKALPKPKLRSSWAYLTNRYDDEEEEEC